MKRMLEKRLRRAYIEYLNARKDIDQESAREKIIYALNAYRFGWGNRIQSLLHIPGSEARCVALEGAERLYLKEVCKYEAKLNKLPSCGDDRCPFCLGMVYYNTQRSGQYIAVPREQIMRNRARIR